MQEVECLQALLEFFYCLEIALVPVLFVFILARAPRIVPAFSLYFASSCVRSCVSCLSTTSFLFLTFVICIIFCC